MQIRIARSVDEQFEYTFSALEEVNGAAKVSASISGGIYCQYLHLAGQIKV